MTSRHSRMRALFTRLIIVVLFASIAVVACRLPDRDPGSPDEGGAITSSVEAIETTMERYERAGPPIAASAITMTFVQFMQIGHENTAELPPTPSNKLVPNPGADELVWVVAIRLGGADLEGLANTPDGAPPPGLDGVWTVLDPADSSMVRTGLLTKGLDVGYTYDMLSSAP